MTTAFGIGDIVRFNDGLSARILELEDGRTRVRLMVTGHEEWRDVTAVKHIITQAPGPRPEPAAPTPTPTQIGAPQQPATGEAKAEPAQPVQLEPTEQVFASETTLEEILQQLTGEAAEER